MKENKCFSSEIVSQRCISQPLKRFWFILLLLSIPLHTFATLPKLPKNKSIDSSLMGSLVMRNFAIEKLGGPGTNWYVNQSKDGTIFLSNSKGLYSYDGSTWRKILALDQIRQFTFSPSGKIFVGGRSDFGYLEASINNAYQFHSLKAQLSENQYFSAINNVYSLDGKIYFVSPEQIMVYQNKKLTFIKPQHKFSRAWLCDDRLFFNDGSQLKYLFQEKIHFVMGFENYGIHSFSFVRKNIGGAGYIIGTFSKGIYLWDQGKVRSLNDKTNSLLNKGFYNSVNIDNDHYAVASIRNGVYFFKRPATVVYHLNNKNGLPNNIAVNLFLDQQRGLWIPQESGLSRTHLPFQLTVLKAPQYNLAKINSMIEHDNKLYLAAVNGVASLDSQGQLKFHDNLVTSVSRIRKYQDTLFIAGARQCQTWNPTFGIIETIVKTPSCRDLLQPSVDPKAAIMITASGIVISQKENSTWTTPKILLHETQINSALVEDEQGIIWTTTNQGDLLKIHKAKSWTVKRLTLNQGPMTTLVLWGKLVIGTDNGLYQWNYLSESLGETFDWFVKQFGAGTAAPEIIQIDAHNRLWIGGQEQSGYFDLENHQVKNWHQNEVKLSGLHNLRYVLDSDKSTWLSFNDGLMQLGQNNYKSDFLVSLIINELKSGTDNIGLLDNDKRIKSQHDISAGLRTRVSWSLRNYVNNDQTLYRYKLDEGNWSEWQNKTYQDFETLSGGSHQLNIEAKDYLGKVWPSKTLDFEVKYLWYQTGWAYAVMILILLMLSGLIGIGLSYYRTKKLLKQKLELENQVKLRTLTIQQQAEELKRKEALKSRFFTNVSHDFRTPLTLTIGPLKSLLNENSHLEPKIMKNIEVALHNSQYMLALVGQILDINRLENNMMTASVEAVDLIEFIKNLLSRFALAGKQRQLQISLETKLQTQALYFDLDHLNKIITNLLSNAIKFSPAEGKITLGLELYQQKLCLSVSDEGPGINSQDREHIFDRYYQGKESSEATHPGTGIGLALVRELLTLHHGEITLDTDYVNGSRFIVTLLLGKDHYPEAYNFDNGHLPDNDEWSGLIPQLPQVEIEKSQSDNNSLQFAIRPTVLVVDDNSEIRNYIKEAIESQYNVVQAGNGIEALSMVSEINPDFIIADIMMPEMDGLTLTHHLKSDLKTAHIPLMLLTSKATKRDTVEGLQEGADDYLTKPFDRSELIARIAAHLTQKQNIARAIYEEYIRGQGDILKSDTTSSFKEQFHTYIIKNLSSYNLDVKMMSNAMNMDRSTLFRQAKKYFGCTPIQYLKQQRLKKALGMLKHQRGTISEIAYAVGFQSLNYFSRTFKTEFNCLPSNFRSISEMTL